MRERFMPIRELSVDASSRCFCAPQFPDNDPRLKGANSEIFMVEAYDRMRKRGYSIGNVDVTLICQKPRVNVRELLPYIAAHPDLTCARRCWPG